MRKLWFMGIAAAVIMGCKKDNSTNSKNLGLSGKYASYKQIDTAFGNPNTISQTSFIGDTLTFISSGTGIASGNGFTTPIGFTYSLTTHTYNNGTAAYQDPNKYLIFQIDPETIELLVIEGTDGTSGNSLGSYYKKQ